LSMYLCYLVEVTPNRNIRNYAMSRINSFRRASRLGATLSATSYNEVVC